MPSLIRYFKLSLFFLVLTLHLHATEPDLTIMIPMSDGVELPTDIYLPTKDAKGLPCILLRGPSGRHHVASATVFAPLAKAGYVVAIQDTRAAADTEGKTLPFFSDGWYQFQDGYDTVEWLAKHELTNGSIGTLGISNMGITQILLAPTAPPSLKCQYIGVAASSLYHHAIYPGGKLLKNQVEGWLGHYAKNPAVLKFVTDRPHYDDFWENFNSVKVANQVVVPAVHQGGWYDIFLQGTLDAFVARQEEGGAGAKGKQKLLIGPWVHMYPSTMRLGEYEVPVAGRQPPVDLSPKSWFDFHLKGMPNKIDETAVVTYYVMGPFDGAPSSGNVWRTANAWPVPHKSTSFYLTQDHELVEGKPPIKETTLSYTHDPANLVPTLGGRNLFLEAGPLDQRPIENRKDVLVFTTPPLQEDLEVTGAMKMKLHFACDHSDTDVAVRLTDVYPDGRSLLISDGIQRTRTHQTDPGELEVDLWSTSMVFAKGHRIRIIIAGSNYPRFEKNDTINTPITHVLQFGGKKPSQLILPLVRKGDKSLTASGS